jgi:hypothetical protein
MGAVARCGAETGTVFAISSADFLGAAVAAGWFAELFLAVAFFGLVFSEDCFPLAILSIDLLIFD